MTIGASLASVVIGSCTRRLKLSARPDSRMAGCRFEARKEYGSLMMSVGFAAGSGIDAGFAAGIGLIPGIELILGGIVATWWVVSRLGN